MAFVLCLFGAVVVQVAEGLERPMPEAFWVTTMRADVVAYGGGYGVPLCKAHGT